jgi:hypothetical protein
MCTNFKPSLYHESIPAVGIPNLIGEINRIRGEQYTPQMPPSWVLKTLIPSLPFVDQNICVVVGAQKMSKGK